MDEAHPAELAGAKVGLGYLLERVPGVFPKASTTDCCEAEKTIKNKVLAALGNHLDFAPFDKAHIIANRKN